MLAKIHRRTVCLITGLAPVQLRPFPVGERRQLKTGNAELFDDWSVHDLETTGPDRPHCRFRVGGQAEVADKQDIERGSQTAGDFQCDRNPSPRQREHDGLAMLTMLQEVNGENSTGFPPVPITLRIVHGAPRFWVRIHSLACTLADRPGLDRVAFDF